MDSAGHMSTGTGQAGMGMEVGKLKPHLSLATACCLEQAWLLGEVLHQECATCCAAGQDAARPTEHVFLMLRAAGWSAVAEATKTSARPLVAAALTQTVVDAAAVAAVVVAAVASVAVEGGAVAAAAAAAASTSGASWQALPVTA